MSCPPQSSPPPTLRQLLEQLAALEPEAAARLRAEVQALEERRAELLARLAADEASVDEVAPDGSMASYSTWSARRTLLAQTRTQLRFHEVDEGLKREQLERELFLARCTQASGRVACKDCQGSGDGPPLDGGTCLVFSSCDACQGTGFVKIAQRT